MNTEQQQQAKHLYLQTNLTKTQIADLLNISRRSLHYWIRDGDWTRLRNSARHLPSLLAENCYHIIAHLTESILGENRGMRPITRDEAETLHKVTLTIGKLKNRSALNESMEMFAFFLQSLKAKAPNLAEEIAPHVDDYISSRAAVYGSDVMPEYYNDQGFIPRPKEDTEELRLDIQYAFDDQENEEDNNSLPKTE